MVSWGIELNQTAKKGTTELQKDKRLVGYPCPDVFCEVYGLNKFFLRISETGCVRMSDA